MGWKVSRTVHKMAFIDEAQIGHARPRRCRRWRVSECNNNVICEFLSTVSTNFAVVAELIGKIFLTKRCFSTNSQHFNFRSPFLAGSNSDNYPPQTVGKWIRIFTLPSCTDYQYCMQSTSVASGAVNDTLGEKINRSPNDHRKNCRRLNCRSFVKKNRKTVYSWLLSLPISEGVCETTKRQPFRWKRAYRFPGLNRPRFKQKRIKIIHAAFKNSGNNFDSCKYPIYPIARSSYPSRSTLSRRFVSNVATLD